MKLELKENMYVRTKDEKIGKRMEHLTRNKNDMMKDVVINYRGCGHKEYYGMLVWRDGLQYCRRCIHQIWVKENPNGWKPGPDEKYFPLYEDGVNYYEKDLKEKENE